MDFLGNISGFLWRKVAAGGTRGVQNRNDEATSNGISPRGLTLSPSAYVSVPQPIRIPVDVCAGAAFPGAKF
jgi:hypothetical protein